MLMLHMSLVYVGTIAAILLLLLAFLSQRYWFARAWRFAGRLQDPSWRKAMGTGLLVLLGVIAVIALADVVANLNGRISRASWWSAFFGFWLSSSILSYILIKVIAGVDWIWRRWRAAISSRPKVSVPTGPVVSGNEA